MYAKIRRLMQHLKETPCEQNCRLCKAHIARHQQPAVHVMLLTWHAQCTIQNVKDMHDANTLD